MSREIQHKSSISIKHTHTPRLLAPQFQPCLLWSLFFCVPISDFSSQEFVHSVKELFSIWGANKSQQNWIAECWLCLLVEETVSWSNLLLMEEEESKCGGGDGERGEQTHQSGTQHREVWQNVALRSSHQMLREAPTHCPSRVTCIGTWKTLLKLFLSVCSSHLISPLFPLGLSWTFVVFVVCLITEGQEVVFREDIWRLDRYPPVQTNTQRKMMLTLTDPWASPSAARR